VREVRGGAVLDGGVWLQRVRGRHVFGAGSVYNCVSRWDSAGVSDGELASRM
jgi:hypothetical protein